MPKCCCIVSCIIIIFKLYASESHWKKKLVSCDLEVVTQCNVWGIYVYSLTLSCKLALYWCPIIYVAIKEVLLPLSKLLIQMNRSCSLTWPTRALDSFVFWVSVLKTNKWCILSKWDHLAYPTEKKISSITY